MVTCRDMSRSRDSRINGVRVAHCRIVAFPMPERSQMTVIDVAFELVSRGRATGG